MPKDSRKLFIVAALLAGAVMPAAASAQTAPAPAEPQGPAAGQPVIGSDDIVVTANRREETVSRAPLTITAVTGLGLQKVGLRDILNIDAVNPSVRMFENNTSGVQTTIRGVVTSSNSLLGDPAIALNFDDAYQARTYATTAMMFDLERMEVLRGPQGTLYGRNATAGAINILTRDPTPVLGGYMSLEGGSYNLIRAEGALNVPLSGTLAARVSFLISKRDGYVGNLSDQDQQGVRLKVKWTPSDHVRATFGLTVARVGGYGTGDVALNAITGKPLDPSHPWRQTLYPAGRGDIAFDQVLATSRFDFNLGFATLSAISSYQRIQSRSPDITLASFRFDDQFKDKQYSQEFRLVSDKTAVNGGDFSWVLGAYYFAERASRTTVNRELDIMAPENSPLIGRDYCVVFRTTPCPSGRLIAARDTLLVIPDATKVFKNIKSDSWAVFGQATFSITDDLRLTGGLRYTKDRKSNDSIAFGIPSVARTRNSNLDYKASVEVDVTDTTLAYATISTGYHSGGSAEGVAPISLYSPEYLTSYDVGFKTRLFDNRLTINISAFHYNYRDFQSSAVGPGDPTRPTTTLQLNIFNIGKVRVNGFEVETTARISPNDRLQLSVSYLDSKITEASDVPGNAIDCACNSRFAGFLQLGTHNGPIVISELKGGELPRAPRWSGSINYVHTFPLAGGNSIDVSLLSRMSSRFFVSNAQVAQVRHITSQNAYTRSDFTLTYNLSDLKLSLSAYVQNIENKAQKAFVFVFPSYTAQLTPPRTYGVRMNWNF